MGRYSKQTPFVNRQQAYSFLREGRHSPTGIRQFPTIKLKNPSVGERAMVETSTHLWSYGDRYYKLAYQYYGNPRYWWVIAWWNGLPTEADVDPGHRLHIPLNLQSALKILGAY